MTVYLHKCFLHLLFVSLITITVPGMLLIKTHESSALLEMDHFTVWPRVGTWAKTYSTTAKYSKTVWGLVTYSIGYNQSQHYLKVKYISLFKSQSLKLWTSFQRDKHRAMVKASGQLCLTWQRLSQVTFSWLPLWSSVVKEAKPLGPQHLRCRLPHCDELGTEMGPDMQESSVYPCSIDEPQGALWILWLEEE